MPRLGTGWLLGLPRGQEVVESGEIGEMKGARMRRPAAPARGWPWESLTRAEPCTCDFAHTPYSTIQCTVPMYAVTTDSACFAGHLVSRVMNPS